MQSVGPGLVIHFWIAMAGIYLFQTSEQFTTGDDRVQLFFKTSWLKKWGVVGSTHVFPKLAAWGTHYQGFGSIFVLSCKTNWNG
jgi:hypothetical protein